MSDFVLLGRTFTSDPASPWAEGVAVREGRLMAVGSADEVRTALPDAPAVEVSLVAPGIQDAHCHPVSSGVERLACDLNAASGPEETLTAVSAYAQGHPEVAWVLGGGWTMSDFPGGTPSRHLLDEVVPDRPVLLDSRDGHSAWANSRALALAGITADTPDPEHGRIEREPDGSPQGTVHEGAIDLVERVAPAPTQADLEAGLAEAQRYLHSLGITAWQDAIVRPDVLEAYRSFASAGKLTAKVRASLWWDRERGLEQIDDLVEMREASRIGRLDAGTVKIMQDGICEDFTAAVIEQYLDGDGLPSGRRGMSFVEPSLLKEAVTRLDRLGFQVHIHAIGERAAREALDAYQAAREAGGDGSGRHHIAHLQIVHPDDIPRFAALDVTANMQPFWACLDDQMRDLNLPFLGPERSGWQYPFAALIAAGTRMAGGSDWSVTTPDPWQEIQIAVTRVPLDHPEREPFIPSQAIRLEDGLRAFTAGSAYVNHLDETGSLVPGKLADLVVLDRDPFAGPPEDIHRTRTLLTAIEGDPVFLDPELHWPS
jgi:predicted amidohydrolase YtcJ